MGYKYRSLLPVYIIVLIVIVLMGSGGSKVITAFSESKPLTNRKICIIDAGHGGEDGGATSCTGILESHINLQIALRLRDVMHLLGIKTILLRETDDALHTEGDTIAARKISDLRQRVHVINNTENAMLISIHQNYFEDSRYSGAQVFYAQTTGSKELAQMLQSAITATINQGSKRQIKKADGIYLMQHIQVPGVLVECGFLSNPGEEALLRDADYQKKLSCVIACCCGRFLHEDMQVT